MKLVMTLVVRDEEDIVGSNIDFHLAQGVDFIIATDNLSVDGTPEILRRYERRGLLHYIHQPEDNFAQHRWVTHMAQMACTDFGADWVINNDADEFWWPEGGDLKKTLAATPSSCLALTVERTNFLPRSMAPGAFFADVMTVRERRSCNVLGDPLPGKVCHRALADIEVAHGNHWVSLSGKELPTQLAPISILHFPVRSYPQLENKIAMGGAACARNTSLPPQIGATWRYLYRAYEAGELETLWRKMILDDSLIDEGLRKDSLVRDHRLERFFSGRRPTPSVP
jgi:hypothetical protein